MVHKAALSTEPAAYRVVTPSQAFTRKISRLIEAVAIFTDRVKQHTTTRGEACHWILGRLRRDCQVLCVNFSYYIKRT